MVQNIEKSTMTMTRKIIGDNKVNLKDTLFVGISFTNVSEYVVGTATSAATAPSIDNFNFKT